MSWTLFKTLTYRRMFDVCHMCVSSYCVPFGILVDHVRSTDQCVVFSPWTILDIKLKVRVVAECSHNLLLLTALIMFAGFPVCVHGAEGIYGIFKNNV